MLKGPPRFPIIGIQKRPLLAEGALCQRGHVGLRRDQRWS